ncbi:MAG: polysaccharide pyruvyl transferase family protein [Acidobacteria bacterium]|nr:polysaccharide pyruvyl transferase family protein [Acidobacteriota bacterium]
MSVQVKVSGRSLRLGVFGTFDVENYGDLLFPLLVEAELSRRLGPLTLQRFSYHSKTTPDWPYEVTSLTELPAMAGDLDGVLIGGGHIIRFDKGVAPGYAPPAPDIHHPTGYWLSPILIALQHGTPVVWNAPGVHGDIPAWADPLMKLAVGGSRYVSVRDESSRRALARFADATEINVVPDAAFGVARLIETRQPSPEFTRLREAYGLNDPYILVQATSELRDFALYVREHKQLFRNHRLLILPTGPIAGDHNAALGDDLPGSVRLPDWPAPLLLAELIGGAKAVVAVSLHLSITALACGVPVFRPARSFGGKYAILSGFEGVFPFDARDGIEPGRFDAGPARDKPSPSMSAALRRLDVHWDRIAAVFLSARESPPALQALSRFWQAMPGLLEARDGQANAVREDVKPTRITLTLRHLSRLRRWALDAK